MSQAKILSNTEINEELKRLPGWDFFENKIKKEFQFADFMAALSFVNKLAPFFEENDHHPDIHIFYNKILFELQRYDVGGKVTDKDILTAHKIEELYGKK